MAKVHGYTLTELENLTGKKRNAIKWVIHVNDIKPIVPEYIYPLKTLDIVINTPPRGRPKKAKE